jgi:hypothetical protein
MRNARVSVLGSFVFIGAMLSGCSGSRPPASGAVIPQNASTRTTPMHSWMLPQAKSVKRLLYVSDFTGGVVYVFDYETGTSEGTLTGFNEPTGQCVDAVGDVWIAQADGQSVTEYAHGGTTPIKQLATSGRAFGCSVSPNGDLAVGNFDVGSAPGSIQVFKGASNPPTQYSCHGFGYFSSPGYDGKGNLYVEVFTTLQRPVSGVCLLPSGGSALQPVTLNAKIGATGSTMWDGKYITLTDEDYNGTYTTAVYQAAESASGNLTVVGTTRMSDPQGRPAGGMQPFILGKKNTPKNMQQATVIVGLGDGVVGYWRYPQGGTPQKMQPQAFLSLRDLFGESVSIGE